MGGADSVCMRLVSFDPLRTLGIPGVVPLKPEAMFRNKALIRDADFVLFPQTWQLNTLCYGLKARVFPSPASYDLGYDKVEMTRAFQAVAPVHVPHTLILPAGESSVEQVLDELGLPVVVKHPRESMGRGVELIETVAELRQWTMRAPVLYVQEYLPIEADLRVVWVGDEVLTAYWRRGGDGFRHNISRGGEADFEAVPAAALALVRQVAVDLGIDHAGFDVAMMGGHPFLFELNLLFGNDALNRRGISVAAAIHRHLLSRWQPAVPQAAVGRP